MRRSSKFRWLGGLAVLALLMAACGPGGAEGPAATAGPGATAAPQEQVELTYWHTMNDPETAQFESVVAAFEAANPGISVETTRYAYDDFKSALLTSIAGGEAPDTARLDIIWVPEFAEMGALLQLDGTLPEFDSIAQGTFPGPLATNQWEDHYYGLPQNTNTQVLLWNREVFEAAGIEGPPQTLEQFGEASCALTQGQDQYGFALGGTYFWAPAPVFYSMGGRVVDEGITTAEGYVNGEASLAAFGMFKDLYDQGCLSPNLLGGGVGTGDGHATGTYAMITDGPWMVDIYQGSFPDFEVNFELVPAGPEGTSSVVGGENVVVFAGSENQEAALRWAQFLLSEESQRLMAEVGVIPTLSSLVGDPAMPEHFGVFMEQLETAQARVPHPKWSDMDNAINNAFQRMLRGEQSVEEALDQAAEEINQLLGQ